MFSSHRASQLCFPVTTLCKTAGNHWTQCHHVLFSPKLVRLKAITTISPVTPPPFFFSHALSVSARLNLNPALTQLKHHRLYWHHSFVKKDPRMNLMFRLRGETNWSRSCGAFQKGWIFKHVPPAGSFCLPLPHEVNTFRWGTEKNPYQSPS